MVEMLMKLNVRHQLDKTMSSMKNLAKLYSKKETNRSTEYVKQKELIYKGFREHK